MSSENPAPVDDRLRKWTLVSAISIMLFVAGVTATFVAAALSGSSKVTAFTGATAAVGFAGMVAGKVGALLAGRRKTS